VRRMAKPFGYNDISGVRLFEKKLERSRRNKGFLFSKRFYWRDMDLRRERIPFVTIP